jgi:nicotinamidase-related amidase
MNAGLPKIDPTRTALLVMDFEPMSLDHIGGADSLIARVSGLIADVRDAGGHVGYVRVAFDDADIAAIPPHSRLATVVAAAGQVMHADSPTTAIHDDLAPQAGDIVVRKTRIGAFSTTDLGKQLIDRDITTLLLAGVSTSGVLLSTVRDAYDRDFQVFVIADASADPRQDVHDFLIEKIFPTHAHVVTTADLHELLQGR